MRCSLGRGRPSSSQIWIKSSRELSTRQWTTWLEVENCHSQRIRTTIMSKRKSRQVRLPLKKCLMNYASSFLLWTFRITRKDEVVASAAFIRRSPRLSSRYSHQPHQTGVGGGGGGLTHQLHSTATRSSRSTTPSTVLNESGQTVPPSFDSTIGEPPARPFMSTVSARLRLTEVQDRPDMPQHLYGEMFTCSCPCNSVLIPGLASVG